jgi:methylthioribose-1-phosphate isomerase
MSPLRETSKRASAGWASKVGMNVKQSPLFQPVLWEGGRFKILDETQLPWKSEYIEVSKVEQALSAVKEMKTRAFGQVLTFFYAAALAARGQSGVALRERLGRLAQEFVAARPTFDFKALAGYFEPWFDSMPTGNDTGSWFEGKIHELVSDIAKARTQRAKTAAELLPSPCRLLTHCNVSGEIVAVAHWSREMGKELRVIATETRPYLQGSRLTAWELARAGVAVDLIPDCAIAQVIAAGKVNAVLVGADRSARNGDIVNKVGTYPIAVVAKEYGVPFYVLVQDPGKLQRGDDVEIEERPASELFQLKGRALFEGAIDGRYPAFDVTPARLITCLIGFDGSHTPESFREKYRPESLARRDEKKAAPSYLLIYGIPEASSYPQLAHALRGEEAAHVLLPEMRPELWGLHAVAQGLREQNVPFQLISDNMMGTLFAQGTIRKLYLFYTEFAGKGPMGICGSLLAVLLARAHGVPVKLFASKAVTAAPRDRDVSTFMGWRVGSDGVEIYPIEKEMIPWAFFKEKTEA